VRMKLNITKIVAMALAIGGIVFLLAGCIGRSNSNTTDSIQTAAVLRGNIVITVTGTGNLALKNKQSLSFGQTGLVSNVETVKVSEVNAVEGQVVDQGQILVKADTTDWQSRITALQHKSDAAKANLVQAQAGVTTAQYNLAIAQNNLATTQYNLATMQYNLATAQYNLKVQQDVKAAQDKIDNANAQLQQAKVMLRAALVLSEYDFNYWKQLMAEYEAAVAEYQKDLKDLLDDPAVKGAPVIDISSRTNAVRQAQAGVEQAQTGVQQAQAGVEQAQKNIELAQANVVVARNAVDDAQTALDQEKSSAQAITSPIRGLITRVNVKKGDIVQRNANIIEIADPDKFEARIMVTERDVTSLTIGRDSSISFDAAPGLSYLGKITRIAPLATVQQGVVNYQITVELTSAKPAPGTGSSAAGTPLIDLKDGFSAVVNIPVQEKDNILMAPSSAISHQGQNYTVQVITGATTETRTVKIGITDFQNTEIIEGLKKGEQVVLPVIPTAAPSTSGGLFGGGGG
jgi:HlyD family secretion protein